MYSNVRYDVHWVASLFSDAYKLMTADIPSLLCYSSPYDFVEHKLAGCMNLVAYKHCDVGREKVRTK